MHQQRHHQTRSQKKGTTNIKNLKTLAGRFHMLIICGDMNAKTGSGNQLYPSVIGKYGKGQTNNNGQQLIEMSYTSPILSSTTRWLTEQHGYVRSAYKIIKINMETSEGTHT